MRPGRSDSQWGLERRRAIAFSVLVAAAAGAVGLWSSGAPAALSLPPVVERNYTPVPTAAACCKVCRKGKACGDTCISRNNACHVGSGCACDG